MAVAKMEMLSDRNIAGFCRSMALQQHAGISLADGVYLLAEEEERQLKELYQHMGRSLDAGEALDTVLEEAGCFPEYVCGMVKIGLQTGKLEQTLDALGAFYDRRDQTRRQIKNALSYPCLVFVLMLVVVAVLLIKVMPVFDGVYGSLGSRLTGVAAGLLHLGYGLEKMLPGLLAALAVAVLFGFGYWKVPALRSSINGWCRKCFGDRGISRKFNNARFAQAVALGLSSGLPLEEAMVLARNLLKEIPGADSRCGLCAEKLANGESLPDAMAAAGLLPPAESRLLTVGLRGGNGDRVMAEIAQRLSRDAQETLEDGVSKIEPALVLAASALVGVILLSVMLPLMNIMAAIG